MAGIDASDRRITDFRTRGSSHTVTVRLVVVCHDAMKIAIKISDMDAFFKDYHRCVRPRSSISAIAATMKSIRSRTATGTTSSSPRTTDQEHRPGSREFCHGRSDLAAPRKTPRENDDGRTASTPPLTCGGRPALRRPHGERDL